MSVEILRQIEEQRLYVGSEHTLELEVGQKNDPLDLTGATATVEAIRPDASAVSFSPGVIPTPATLGLVRFTFSTTSLNQEGDWNFRAKVTFSTGEVIDGNPVIIPVFTPGQLGLA